MKRFILPLLVFLLLSIFFPVASFAEGNRSITILYTGSVKGSVDPLVGCACGKAGNLGGLARRAQMIESIRKDKRSILLLDCGAVFGPRKDNAELQLNAMHRMGYDALNLGTPELYFGKAFLDRSRSRVSFPYIASNLLYGGSGLPWAREYVIKEVGGIKAAILGILDPDELRNIPRHDDVKGFEIISPKAALDRLLPQVRGKADLVILLSPLGEAENRALIEAVQGIDVVITTAYQETVNVKPLEKTVILNTASNGMALGLATIILDDKRTLSVSERKYVLLDPSVPDNAEMAGFIQAYEKEQEIKKEQAKKEQTELLQLSPQEFMERYLKKQAEQRKGESR